MEKIQPSLKVALLDARLRPTNTRQSTTIAYRNLVELKRYLQGDLFSDWHKLRGARDDYDVIICGFGSLTTEINKSTTFLQRNKKAKLIWLVGEYEQSTFQPLFYSCRPYHILKNFEHHIRNKQAISQHFVNLNSLIVSPPSDSIEDSIAAKKYGAIYYGRWRENRRIYFERYLQQGIYLSTSVKNMKIYISAGCAPTFIRPLSWRHRSLKLFNVSLYLEDVFTHTHYNCAANRFYEALMTDAIICTQPEAKETWVKSGYDVNARVVNDYNELISFSEMCRDPRKAKTLIEEQRVWLTSSVQEKQQTLKNIREIINNVCPIS